MLNMIANLLQYEASHSSIDLCEEPALLMTLDGSFCQKLGPVHSPDGPMLGLEVVGGRNNFIDLQKHFWKSNAKFFSLRELISNMTRQLLVSTFWLHPPSCTVVYGLPKPGLWTKLFQQLTGRLWPFAVRQVVEKQSLFSNCYSKTFFSKVPLDFVFLPKWTTHI